MNETSIYQAVRSKLITHGADKTKEGRVTFKDPNLFGLFVKLEKAAKGSSFSATQSTVQEIEDYAFSIGKRHLVVFALMYLRFSDLTPKTWELDEELPDGKVKTTNIYERELSEEEMLIGLWAKVRYDSVGQDYLSAVYKDEHS
ncbi:hypothetical protein [Ruegeria lacuscaerulensis]|uniref:hypothetical protein n=1 Tax=Ruegeria lacuscaerulensis TaxID=55218 RepID=UPI00147F7C22|nr:hypothetical protein [Ruegeria lacuscaerulensis]